MEFHEMYTAIDKYGWKGIFLSLMIIIIITLFKSKWISNKWSQLTDKFIEFFMRKKVEKIKTAEISESDIINHDIFNYIDFWTFSKIPTFTFSTDYRTIVFKKYLTIFLRCYKTGISEFTQSREYQSMDKSELWKSLLELINKIVWNYEKECEEAGIPKIIVMKMKSKNNDTITLTIDLIESISNSNFYEGDKNFLKLYSIINIMLSILENTIANSQSVCDSINGQIKGLSIIENGKTYTEP